jgi:hypothetical protein
MGGELFTLEARPQRLALEARPLAVRQRAAVQRQPRRLCVTCYEPRPEGAILAAGVCVVCVARQRKVAAVDQRLQQDTAQRTQERHDRAVKARRAQKERGHGPGITLKRKGATDSQRRAVVSIIPNRKRL